MAQFTVEWLDKGREPQCQPNPNFPNGRHVDLSHDGDRVCFTDLSYPAKRCGLYVVECRTCGLRIGVTTAGRPDDPRSIKFACGKPEAIQ